MASGPGAQTATEGNGDGAHGSKRRRTDASGAAHPNSDAGGPTTAGDGSAAGSAAAQWAPPLESSPSATAVQPDASSRDWVAEPSPLLYCELCHNVFTDEVR